jgi:hypothetical protein
LTQSGALVALAVRKLPPTPSHAELQLRRQLLHGNLLCAGITLLAQTA